MPSKKQKAKEAKLKKKRAAMQAAADTGAAEPEEKLPEGELLEWLHDQILLKWQGKLSPAHEAKLDTLPPPGDQWCSLKNQFRLACNVLGGSIEGEPADDVMKQVIDIAKEHVREGSPPTIRRDLKLFPTIRISSCNFVVKVAGSSQHIAAPR